MRKENFILAWAVICKFMRKVMKGEKKNEGSQYNVEINLAMYIDAEKEGNCT